MARRWVVVGAGSAGAVVAARLAQRAGDTVVLVEAGPDDPGQPPTPPPAIAGQNFLAAVAEPGRTWHQPAQRSRHQSPRPYVRGRGMGGSSAVNALVVSPGLPGDYDDWARRGATGWAWSDVRPTFAALARGRIPRLLAPLSTWSPLERAVAEASMALGVPWCPDPDVPQAPVGVGPAALAVRGGRRVSSYDAFLAPARGRSNLTVMADAAVDRVVLAGDRAVGVRLVDGTGIDADGVVLCAGALQSPAILLRSGVDRPGVGASLVEHASAGFTVVLRPRARLADAGARPVSSVVRLTSGLAEAGPADLQVLTTGATGPDDAGRAAGSIQVALMRVFSRGRVTLADHDPVTPPDVRFDLLADDRDRTRLAAAVRHLLRVVDQPAVADVAELVAIDDQGTPAATLGGDDGAVERWLEGAVGAYVHAAGTCRMGRVDDPLAVVDPHGAVIGTRGLWVVDASIMPDLPRAGPHLPTVMLAERLVATLPR